MYKLTGDSLLHRRRTSICKRHRGFLVGDGVISVRKDLRGLTAIHQSEPMVVSVKWSESFEKPYRYTMRTIEVPYVVSQINFSANGRVLSGFMWFAKDPVTGPNSKLYKAYLPNVSFYGSVCFGHGSAVRPFDASGVMSAFWSRGFNRDLRVSCSYRHEVGTDRPPGKIETIDRWEKNTRENPGFSTKMKMKYIGEAGNLLPWWMWPSL